MEFILVHLDLSGMDLHINVTFGACKKPSINLYWQCVQNDSKVCFQSVSGRRGTHKWHGYQIQMSKAVLCVKKKNGNYFRISAITNPYSCVIHPTVYTLTPSALFIVHSEQSGEGCPNLKRGYILLSKFYCIAKKKTKNTKRREYENIYMIYKPDKVKNQIKQN